MRKRLKKAAEKIAVVEIFLPVKKSGTAEEKYVRQSFAPVQCLGNERRTARVAQTVEFAAATVTTEVRQLTQRKLDSLRYSRPAVRFSEEAKF